MLLRAILSGGVWNGFLLSKVKKEEVPCRFCGAPDNDGHLFWDCTFPPFVELRNQPEFLPLMRRGSVALAQVSSLAWMVTWVVSSYPGYPLGRCIQ